MSSAERTTVQLPSLIVSFLDEEPNTHPLYERVRRESLDWVTTACALDRKTVIKVHKGDLTYFAAVCAPEAEDARYRVFCDWVNWVFPFDDQYDDGELRDDPRRAALELGNLIDNVYGRASPMTKYVKAHEDVWRRFEEVGLIPALQGERRR